MRRWIAAAGALAALAGVPSVAVADDVLAPIHRRTDPATGALIQLFRPSADRGIVEVLTPAVKIQKTLESGRVRTRVASAAEDLTITLDRGGVLLTDGRTGLTVDGRGWHGLQQVRRQLQASSAIVGALTLLEALEPQPGSPITHSLLVTQALLESALDRPEAGRALARWVRRPVAGVKVTRVSGSYVQDPQEMQEGPTDCWDQYATEAIAAWMEYEQCVDAEEWWDAPGLLSCLMIYEMRAIGAFSWWVSCVGFRG